MQKSTVLGTVGLILSLVGTIFGFVSQNHEIKEEVSKQLKEEKNL